MADQKEPDALFRYLADHEAKTLDVQLSMARWVIATLLLVNGGALVAILNAADTLPEIVRPAAGFVWGVIAAIVSGIMFWIGLSIIGDATSDRIDFDNLTSKDSKVADKKDRWAALCAILATAAAILSLVCFTLSAFRVGTAIDHAAVQKAGERAFLTAE